MTLATTLRLAGRAAPTGTVTVRWAGSRTGIDLPGLTGPTALLRELPGWPRTVRTASAWSSSGVSVAVTIPQGNGDADAHPAERQQQGH
jgi:hypothetical protein